MFHRRWQRQVLAEIDPALTTLPPELAVHVDVPGNRAGVARRRLRWIATELKPYGYALDTVDPTRNRATGRFSIAHFRRRDAS